MTVVTDNFNRANSSNLGASWTEVVGDWEIVSNQAECNNDAGATGYYCRYESDVGSSDMYSEAVTNSTQTNGTSNAGVAVRMRAAANTSYQFTTNLNDNHAFWRIVAGAETQIATLTSPLAAGDTIRAEVVGRTLRAKINGTLVGLAQDANITDGQRAGLNGYNNVGTDVVRLDNFEGGALTDDLVAPYTADWSTQATGTTTTLTPTIPAQVTAGDLVVTHATSRDAAQTMAAPAGEGWSTQGSPSQTGLEDLVTAKVWGLGGQTDDTTPTFTIGSGTAGWGVTVTVYRNPKHATNPWTSVADAIVAAASQANASSTTVTAPSATHTGSNRTVVRYYSSADDNALATPSTGALVYGGAAYDQTTGNDYAQACSVVEDVTVTTNTGTATVTETLVGPDVSNGVTLVLAIPAGATNLVVQDATHSHTAGSPTLSFLSQVVRWQTGDVDRFTNSPLSTDASMVYGLDIVNERGRIRGTSGSGVNQSNQREVWVLDDSTGLAEHARTTFYSGDAFGTVDVGVINPQHGIAFRVTESGGRRSAIVVDNNIFFGSQWTVWASVWSGDIATPTTANFLNRQAGVSFEPLLQQVAVLSATRTSNVVTLVAAAGEEWYPGDRINVNLTNDTFDGAFIVASVDGDTLTYPQTGTDASGGTGTVTKVFPYDVEAKIDPPGSTFCHVRAKPSDQAQFPAWTSYDSSAGLRITAAGAGSPISTPDHASLDITGDLAGMVEATLPNWQPGTGNDPLIAKRSTTAGQASWFFTLNNSAPAGRLELWWSANGSTLISATSTTPVTFGAGERGAVAFTLDVDNGASGRTITFYTGPSIDGPWTQLGDPVVQAGVTSIFNSTSPVEIGSQQAGSNSLRRLQTNARIHAVKIRPAASLTGGTPAVDVFGPNLYTGQTTFTCRAGRAFTVASPGVIENAGMPTPATALAYSVDLDQTSSEAVLAANPTPADPNAPMGLIAAHLGTDSRSAVVFGRSTFGTFEIHDLAVDDATHTQTADNVTVTTSVDLAPDDATHTHTAESVAVTQAHQLAADNATHGHAAGSVALTQTHSLTAADATHAHTAAGVVLDQAHNLTVDAAAHTQTAASPALTQAHELDVAAAGHGHTADAVTLSVGAIDLTVQGAAHSQVAGTPGLTQAHTLTVASAVHGQTAEALSLSQSHVLAPADATHGHSATSPALSQIHVLAVQDTGHAHTVDEVTLVVGGIGLAVADAVHAQSSDSVALAQQHSLAVTDAAQAHTAGSPALHQAHSLSPADASHGQIAQSVTLAQIHGLTVQDATQAHTVDSVALVPGDAAGLTVQNASHAHIADVVELLQRFAAPPVITTRTGSLVTASTTTGPHVQIDSTVEEVTFS